MGRGVFIVVFVKSKALWSQHHPDLLPLAHAAFGFEDIEPAVVDDALVVGCGADVALLARVGLLLLWCSRGGELAEAWLVSEKSKSEMEPRSPPE